MCDQCNDLMFTIIVVVFVEVNVWAIALLYQRTFTYDTEMTEIIKSTQTKTKHKHDIWAVYLG